MPWLLLLALLFLAPYARQPGGVAAKYIWDEHGVTQLYPAWWFARHEVLEGVLPFWNPYAGCGHPALANLEDEFFSPLSPLNYLLPFPLGPNLMIAAQVLIGLAGTFALARGLSASRPASILAAALHVFSGFVATNVNHIIPGAYFMPWLCFALHRLAICPCPASFFGTAVAFAVSLLFGNPQLPVLSAGLGLGLYYFTAWTRPAPRGVGRLLLLPGGAMFLGAILAVPALVPFAEYLSLAFTHHLPGFGSLHADPAAAVASLIPLWDPVAFLSHAEILKTPARTLVEQSFPPKSYAAGTMPYPPEYLGGFSVLFLILGLGRLRRLPREAAFFAGFAIFDLGVIFGFFPFSLLTLAPPFTRMSNWRFTAVPLALCLAVLAAIAITRLPSIPRSSRIKAVAVWAAIIALGSALLTSRGRLPLDDLLILGPALFGAGLAAILGAVLILAPKPWLLVLLGTAELLIYDQALNRPVFKHPHLAFRQPSPILARVQPDPQYRFLDLGETIHPNLSALLGLYDFRHYDVLFPKLQIEWIQAANGWDRLDAIAFFLQHYFFTLSSRALVSAEPARASVRWVLAPDFLPLDPEGPLAYRPTLELSGQPTPAQQFEAEIGGVAKKSLFMHAPSSLALAAGPDRTGPKRIAGAVALAPWAWDPKQGDGVAMSILAGQDAARSRLVYFRYLDPHGRTGERRWLPLEFAPPAAAGLRLATLPGPAGDVRSDFALWADLHDPAARARIDERWRLLDAGPIKLYENLEVRPRLRVAAALETVRDRAECLAGMRSGRFAEAAEVIEDETGQGFSAGSGRIESVTWGSDRIAADLMMEGPGVVVLADTYYPGWRAWVDGAETRIRRANCAFRAVAAPAGARRIEFRFIPTSFRLGLFAGLTSWVLAAGCWLRGRGRARSLGASGP